MIKIGTKLRNLRVEQGLTQKDLAARVNWSRDRIARYEHDYNSPTLRCLELIAKSLNISLDDLFKQ